MNLMCVGREMALAGGYKLENSFFFFAVGRSYLGPPGVILKCTHRAFIWQWERKRHKLLKIPKSLSVLGNIFHDSWVLRFLAVFLPPTFWPLTRGFNFPPYFPMTVGKGCWRPRLGPSKLKKKTQNLGRKLLFFFFWHCWTWWFHCTEHLQHHLCRAEHTFMN